MKKVRLILVVAIVAIALIFGIVSILANPNRHREAIQARLENQLGRRVTLGDMSLRFFPIRFQVANVSILEDDAFGKANTAPFVHADKLDVSIGLAALLSGAIQVNSLELLRPTIQLLRTTTGIWNFSTLGPKAEPNPNGSGSSKAPQVTLARLSVVDGEIGITDLMNLIPHTVYDHIDLALSDYAPGQAFAFEMGARTQGEGNQTIRLTGEAGPLASGNVGDTPFHGKLNVDHLDIDGLMKFLGATPGNKASGTLLGETELQSRSGVVSAEGNLKIDGASFNSVAVGYPIGLTYKLSSQVSEGLTTIENGTLQLGPTPLTVTGTLSTSKSKPILDLHLRSGEASIAEVARLASAFGIGFAPGSTVTGNMTADLTIKGDPANPSLNGVVKGRGLQISGAGMPQPVQVQTLDLTLSPDVIRSNEFNATSGKTSVMGRFSVQQYASKSPSIDLGLRSGGATLPEIQTIAKAYGVTGLDSLTGEGSLNFDMRANGPIQSLTAQSAVRALNGVINLDFSPLHIAGFDAVHELGKLGGFASSLSEEKTTDILHVAGRILVKDGVAETNDLQVQTAIGNIAASGIGDLATEKLNLKLSAIFSKSFADKASATRAGGFLNTALSNNAGELVLPALVTGTFSHPQFAPDLNAVAQMQKQKLLPTLNNPAAAVSNVLGALKEKKTEASDQPAESKTSIIKGIFGALGGKPQEPAKQPTK